ncbi:hypothetical protein ACSMXM_02790 [Pacificimonas sp. ICDLI1SI03]
MDTNDRNTSDSKMAKAKGTVSGAADSVKGAAASARDYTTEHARAARDYTTDHAKAAKDYTAQKYAEAKDYSSDRYGRARDYSKERYEAAREYGGESWARTQESAAAARERTAREVEANPLTAAGLGLLAGAAIGLLLPRTRQENRAIGGIRDGLFDQAAAAAAAAKTAGLERVDELGLKDQAKSHLSEMKDQAVEAAKSAGQAAKGEVG